MVAKRKLIEVALPLEAINRESAREKSIRHGHPSTLHLWWARRPLAACRAVLFASLVDDPSSNPDRFPTEEAQTAERRRLFGIIEELVKWENTTDDAVLEAARAEIRSSCDGDPPAVLDPFCGGGSIPLEAQRLGLEAHARDLNPVAVLITRALVEIPARFGGPRLAGDIRRYGRWLREEAFRRIGHLYPRVAPSGEAVVAWIWARTVRSPNPAWGGPMPLVRSFALSTKPGRETWVHPVVDREAGRFRFEIRTGPGCPPGTVGRQGAVCLATATPVPLSYIREEGRAGRVGAQLMAIVADGEGARIYLPPDEEHEEVARSTLAPEDTPGTDLPARALSFRVQAYGMTKHRQLFTARQLAALCTFTDLVGEARQRMVADGADDAYADAVATYLALGVSRVADRHSALTTWDASPSKLQVRGVFARQALPMAWDFAEGNIFGGSSGGIGPSFEWVARVVERLGRGAVGDVRQLDAAAGTGAGRPVVCVTDPPYYDNIGYADLSDFFYVWLRRALKDIHPEVFGTLLVPKGPELVATPHRFEGKQQAADEHFERGLGAAFRAMRATQAPDFPFTIIYAFKQTGTATGWETMLAGLLGAGLAVSGTWPLRSELSNRMLARGTNALASSIALVCRPRPANARAATRKDFLARLRAELPPALRHLQQGNIAPVDLAQAAIGPGMAVFSRYANVVEADGSAMTVGAALGLINAVLEATLSEQESDFDAETRWALAWFEETGMNPGAFGKAETLSRAKNISITDLVRAGIVDSKAGKVRLLDRGELRGVGDGAGKARLTGWEVTQHLIHALDTGGEAEAAEVLRRRGGRADAARPLAYRLYVMCERREWTAEALAYNGLVVAWPEIYRLAATR